MGVRGLSLPFARRPSSSFGRRWLVLPGRKGFWNDHEGTDWAGPRGTPLPALGAGRIYDKRFTSLKGHQVGIDYGRIDGHNWKSRWHMLNEATPFEVGDPVHPGETVGGMGMSGTASNGVHGHGELLCDDKPVNMLLHLDYTGFLSLGATPIPITDTTPEPLKEYEMSVTRIVSPGGQGFVVDGHYIDAGSAENVQQTIGMQTVTTTLDMHNRIIGALSKQDNLPIIVYVPEGDGTIFQLIGDRFAPIADIKTVQQLQGLGASSIHISKAERDNWLKKLT